MPTFRIVKSRVQANCPAPPTFKTQTAARNDLRFFQCGRAPRCAGLRLLVSWADVHQVWTGFAGGKKKPLK